MRQEALDGMLFAAAVRRDASECERLMALGANPNATAQKAGGEERISAVERAAKDFSLDCLRPMLPKAELLRESPEGSCPWGWIEQRSSMAGMAMAEPFVSAADASKIDWAQIARLAVEARSDDEAAEPLLRAVAKRRNLGAVRAAGRPLLMHAVGENKPPKRIMALLAHCDPNEKGPSKGETALIEAATLLRVEAIEALLPVSDADLANNEGRTALMVAANHSWIAPGLVDRAMQSFRMLLPVSDLSAQTAQGKTVLAATLEIAAESDNGEMIELLIARGRAVFGAETAAVAQAALGVALAKGRWSSAEALSAALSAQEALAAVEKSLREQTPKLAALCEAAALAKEANIAPLASAAEKAEKTPSAASKPRAL